MPKKKKKKLKAGVSRGTGSTGRSTRHDRVIVVAVGNRVSLRHAALALVERPVMVYLVRLLAFTFADLAFIDVPVLAMPSGNSFGCSAVTLCQTRLD